MIIKFDGVDGCGKSTLSRAVAEQLSSRNYTVAQVSEFSSPVNYTAGSTHAAAIDSMRIREAVLNPAFDCDDVERQLLLHFLSRRRNRVEIPHLDRLCDFVVVDRSTLSNYAYAGRWIPGLPPCRTSPSPVWRAPTSYSGSIHQSTCAWRELLPGRLTRWSRKGVPTSIECVRFSRARLAGIQPCAS